MIGLTGLATATRRKAGGYSLGMRQRLGIAAALLGDPPVLMLDEPFNGLDPEGILWMRGFLRTLAAEGRSVLVSSHLMSELQDAADHLVVAGRGRVVADTSVADLIAAASGDRVTLRTEARSEAMTVLASAGATVTATGRDTVTVAGLPAGQIVAVLGESSGAVQRGLRAPRHPGGGIYGADPRRHRVPRCAGDPVSAPVIAPYRSALPAGRDGFAQLVRAEWTKLRTVRGWVIGLLLVIVATDLIGLFGGGSSSVQCHTSAGTKPSSGAACAPKIPTGPGGEAVNDAYYLVGQPLSGDGTLTARVTSLTTAQSTAAAGPSRGSELKPGPVPWAKAGIIVTASTRPGAAYAAMMVTPGHGVRMQYNYTGDSGPPGAVSGTAPRWLRLTRAGTTVTGWTRPTACTGPRSAPFPAWARRHRPGRPVRCRPGWETQSTNFGGGETGRVVPAWPPRPWTGSRLGRRTRAVAGHDRGRRHAGPGRLPPVRRAIHGQRIGATSGHWSRQRGPGTGRVERALVGAFAGLIAVIVVAVMFITAEYRRGLIRTTLAASPRRGRVLAAKALVAGAATFAVGLVAAVIAVAGGRPSCTAIGYVLPGVAR